jgi:uracil-DNA glycosylase family 4
MGGKVRKLAEIDREVAACRKCPLWRGATNPVPGAGSAEAEVMFIGEGPGFYEDKQGLPFVGPAGKLLDQLLEMIGLRRTEVFIANMIKHRPPGNRDPLPQEMAACSGYLERQIEVVEPKVIVPLGRFSMGKFIPGVRISQVHGQARFVQVSGRKVIVIPMYHPAAALRAGRIMEELKKDFLVIGKFLNKGNQDYQVDQVDQEDKVEKEEEQVKQESLF